MRYTATHSYPIDYRETTAQEELDQDFRPVLTDTVENLAQYDSVILGYLIWWGATPMAVRTFLESCDLNGKTIVSFSTHEGSSFRIFTEWQKEQRQHSGLQSEMVAKTAQVTPFVNGLTV